LLSIGGANELDSIPHDTGLVASEGETIYFELTGRRTKPALVLCHGLGGNHASWVQQVPAFAIDYCVVTWDQRGFGRSSNRTGDVGLEAAVLDLKHLLDRLHIERAHVVGQSMGGWTALGFAIREQGRVASLVLSDTIAGIYTTEAEAAFDAALKVQREASPKEQIVALGRHPALGEQLAESDPARAFLYQQIAGLAPPPPRQIPVLLRNTSYKGQDLESLECAVLFIVGSDDPIFPPRIIRSSAARLPAARVVEFAGAGHSPYFEVPDQWNSTVRSFIQEVGG
jgi:pimeloyl-ACP methyl ester carboxylesterase